MSKNKNKSLVRQVQEVFKSKLRIGEAKHDAKKQGGGGVLDGIYSWNTYRGYLNKSLAFARWAKEHYGVKTLITARPYVDAYLQHYIDREYSPYTQKTIASALAKLYGCSTKDFIPTQTRHRANITRSRKGKSKVKFSEVRNQEFVDFCRATGLRRHEIKKLKPENLGFDKASGRYVIMGLKGKGGRPLEVPVLCEKAVDRIKSTPAGQLVWDRIPSNADIHSYRADYCKSIYIALSRKSPRVSVIIVVATSKE